MPSAFRNSMSEPEKPEQFLEQHSGDISGSLCVFGDWFGRPMDNWHQLIRHEAGPGYIKLSFNEGETLEVWQPKGLRMEGKAFIIQTAARVRWEWFYYGRPKLPENRFVIEHAVTDRGVQATSNADWAPRNFHPSLSEPAVSIM